MELLLDSRIMWWVFLPIVYVTFILSIVRMLFSKYQLYNTTKKPIVQPAIYRDHTDRNTIGKCEMLIKKNAFITEEAFNSRRTFLCKPEDGYLTKQREVVEAADPMAQMQTMMEGMGGTLPTILISIVTIGWINYSFGGILLAKVPFTLSQHFKTITQSGIEMENLSVQYISGISFYFLIMFGLGQIYQLFMKEEEDTLDSLAGNKKQKMGAGPGAGNQMGMNPMMPPMMPMNQQMDPKDKAKEMFKNQIQNLCLVHHKFMFENCPKSAVNRLKKFLVDE